MEDSFYQTVYIQRKDGVWGEFHGKVLLENQANEITQIKMSQPKRIPDNLTWEDLYEQESTKEQQATTTSDT